jgi:hypothetical protein
MAAALIAIRAGEDDRRDRVADGEERDNASAKTVSSKGIRVARGRRWRERGAAKRPEQGDDQRREDRVGDGKRTGLAVGTPHREGREGGELEEELQGEIGGFDDHGYEA